MFPERVFQALGRELVGWRVSVGSGVGVVGTGVAAVTVLEGPETQLVELE